jgi:hypothetical protein
MQDLHVARLELNLQKEVAAKSLKTQEQRQQAAVDNLKRQHAAARKAIEGCSKFTAGLIREGYSGAG